MIIFNIFVLSFKTKRKMIYLDTYRHKGLRLQLVNELKQKGVSDPRILEAFLKIPRHYFLEPVFADWAYKDVAFPIDADQTISQPMTVAQQSALLDIKRGDKVLEVGTGSGFQACVLNFLGAKVYTIERQKTLFERTSRMLDSIGFGAVRTLYGDGYEGAPRFAPFDKIIVTAGSKNIPQTLIDQLKVGGVMVIPTGESDDKVMLQIVKQEDGSLITNQCGTCRFVPFLEGVN
jgi:protein-L-isoaspartate(D-aspartate) O-methyltransferase